jgi:tetratricopeptide (TPR) repeat protein
MYHLSRQELNRLSECVNILEWLRETDHAHLLGHTQLGTCLMKMKDYARAREVFTSVLEVDPDHLMALQNYGIMLIELQENREALEIFTHLSRLDPSEVTFVQQAELLHRHIQKQSRRKVNSEGSTQN